MMKLLSSTQIRNWDSYTIERESLSGLGLMERAATRCFHALVPDLSTLFGSNHKKVFTVYCGQGNNGGDGLVIARLLKEEGYTIRLYVLQLKEKGSEDFEINLLRCLSVGIEVKLVIEEEDIPEIDSSNIIIDAIFGSGLTKPLEGTSAKLVQHINQSQAYTISIDIPSGLFADIEQANTQEFGAVVKANKTYTFQVPKTSFLFPESGNFVGDFTVIDIDLSEEYLSGIESNWNWYTEELPKQKTESRFNYKWQKGHLLFIGGSYGKMGAALLSSKAAMRTGCGLLTSFIPSVGYAIFQTALPEVMVVCDAEPNEIRNFPEPNTYDAIAIGPGLGTHTGTQMGFKKWIAGVQKPIVLDADALNICAKFIQEDSEFKFPINAIITPHAKEFDRMFGACNTSYERLLKAMEVAINYKIVVVLKGSFTQVVLQSGKVFFNSSGNTLLATAGSGDVLTGIISSLLAQGFSSDMAALKGVFLHGKLANSLKQKGVQNCIAGDLVEELKWHLA